MWVREFGDVNSKKHYHVLLFLNKDVYHFLGDFRQERGNLSVMIKEAWSSATGLPLPLFGALAHFPKGGQFYLDKNSYDIQGQMDHLIKYASYLAKNKTKRYGDGERSIGTFRIAAGQARDIRGETLPTEIPNRLSMTLRRPVGVMVGIGPLMRHCY